ncbi:MAG: hypothetical protein ACREFP_20730 [Acetobacteraceae bacterium]
MDDFAKRKEARRRKAYERLGSTNFRCVTCGEDNPHCLELHHLAGQKFGTEEVPLCRNCHRKLSDDQKDHPRPISDDPDWVERIGHYLLGFADMLVFAAETLKEFGRMLIEKARTIATEGSHS